MKDRNISSSVLEILSKDPDHTYNYKQIAALLGVKDAFIRKRIVTILAQLAKDGHLDEISRGKYQIKNASKNLNFHEIDGTIEIDEITRKIDSFINV